METKDHPTKASLRFCLRLSAEGEDWRGDSVAVLLNLASNLRIEELKLGCTATTRTNRATQYIHN